MDEKLKRPDLKSDKWQKQASGLEIWDEKVGVGEAVKAGANVKVHYTGWLTDDNATIFDSSVKRNEPIEFGLTQVIKGWQEGIPGMKPGGVRLLKIPGIDLQPCGGTHVKNIAEIGGIRVVKIRSEGKRNKRVEIALA